uniref:Beta/gamma crystallin 'Greek key' domain-containing protein n=1 Tax=Ornithorhynchus anatinus TaxID=9258 RepID=A0A6I8N7Z2_ORNAN
MGKIIFYEDRAFRGRCHERSSDHSNLQAYFSRCNSIRVESGSWMFYLRPGDYPDYQHWMGLSDAVRSCRLIPAVSNPCPCTPRLISGNWDPQGFFLGLQHDCPASVQHHRIRLSLLSVLEGCWILYEMANSGAGSFCCGLASNGRFPDWGAADARAGSLRRVLDLYGDPFARILHLAVNKGFPV